MLTECLRGALCRVELEYMLFLHLRELPPRYIIDVDKAR